MLWQHVLSVKCMLSSVVDVLMRKSFLSTQSYVRYFQVCIKNSLQSLEAVIKIRTVLLL